MLSKLCAILEATTGLALIAIPLIVVWLLFNAEISGATVAMARVTGISLFSLGLAVWPGKETTYPRVGAILSYNLLVTLYLSYVGIRGEWVGILLWPAAVLHAVLTLLLARAWFPDLHGQDCEEK